MCDDYTDGRVVVWLCALYVFGVCLMVDAKLQSLNTIEYDKSLALSLSLFSFSLFTLRSERSESESQTDVHENYTFSLSANNPTTMDT